MNRKHRWPAFGLICALGPLTATTRAQISVEQGDRVLNAPYRGTIDSLREATMDIPYGEVMTHVEPSGQFVEIYPYEDVLIWHETSEGYEAWDRSVLRMYRDSIRSCSLGNIQRVIRFRAGSPDLTPEDGSSPYVRIMRFLDLKGSSGYGEETAHGGTDHIEASGGGGPPGEGREYDPPVSPPARRDLRP